MEIVYNKYDTWYHVFVAPRKPYRKVTGKKQSKESGSRAIVIFWLIFVIVIIFVFMLNAETIKKNFDMFMTRLTNSPLSLNTEGLNGDLQEEDEVSGEAFFEQQRTDGTGTGDSNQIVVVIDNSAGTSTANQPPEEQRIWDTVQSQTQPESTEQQPQTPRVEDATPVQTRERTVYFTQIDKDGQILQSRITRILPVTETPMMDVLNVMLAGPSADEINRGILNLIPRNTRLLNATVRGSTAYLSFSEDFLFNTFGVEGYVAQLRQIVWTVTEFSNVLDVQILVEGRRIDYLGEGIYIGSPISRQSF